jgi:hypothetical protein
MPWQERSRMSERQACVAFAEQEGANISALRAPTAREAGRLRLGVDPWQGAFNHPQTQGKVELFHGTIAAEGFARRHFADLAVAQAHSARAAILAAGPIFQGRPHVRRVLL